MKLKSLLTIFFLFSLTFFLLVLISITKLTDLLENEASEISLAGESVRMGEELKSTLLRHNRNSFLYSIHRDQWRKVRKDGQEEKINELLEQASHYISNDKELEVLEEIKKEVQNYFYAQNEATKHFNGSPLQKYEHIGVAVDRVLGVIDKFVTINHLQMTALLDDVKDQNKMADILAIWILAIVIAIVAFIFIGVSMSVIKPLLALNEVIGKYSGGQLSTRAQSKGLHEIRSIAHNFNQMADHIEVAKQDQFRFMAAVAHDLRNPLASLKSATELLILNDKKEDQELLSIINGQINNLETQVSDLLDMTKIEAGQLTLKYEHHDLRDIITREVNLYRLSATIHQFRLQLGNRPLLCSCDSTRMSQVLGNLLSNALKYSPAGGVIDIEAHINKNRILIEISDQGIGIEEADLENIFKPFKRSQATKNTIMGVGLGLSTSRHIIEAHGGTLSVRSTPGRGSTFTLNLEKELPQTIEVTEAYH